MRDVLEERLAARLRDLGDVTPVELEPPADLNLRVRRRKRRTRVVTRWVGLGIAAAAIIGVTTATVLQGTTGRPGVDVSVHPPAAAPHDALPAGTVLLAAKGRDVVALDATGHTLATMIHAERGAIQYAQVTADHRWLWYLSRKGAGACADVVRADIDGRTSKIVTQAAGFAISPDGSRLALFGAGDIAHHACIVPGAVHPTRVVVEDVNTGQTSALADATEITGLQWAPGGTDLIALSCTPTQCNPLQRIDVPSDLRLPLVRHDALFDSTSRSSSAAFGADGLYVLQTSARGQAVATYDPQTFELADTLLTIDARWRVLQVAPTDTTTFVVVAADHRHPSLYEINTSRRLQLVRSTDPGVLTPVFPLPAAG
jgi:hypothetical protein